ncbi:DUF5955 family protein [Streptomyces sp. NRRL B-24484]|uniref:DUF5955 family protein n=1 Tax=Streptomyces sp. NRRL B-24484 TaxID=1463833 RepID=UPI0004BFE5BD|nr:DUF5955 family protein [Streptomyces sp. NRRL B-24484]
MTGIVQSGSGSHAVYHQGAAGEAAAESPGARRLLEAVEALRAELRAFAGARPDGLSEQEAQLAEEALDEVASAAPAPGAAPDGTRLRRAVATVTGLLASATGLAAAVAALTAAAAPLF